MAHLCWHFMTRDLWDNHYGGHSDCSGRVGDWALRTTTLHQTLRSGYPNPAVHSLRSRTRGLRVESRSQTSEAPIKINTPCHAQGNKLFRQLYTQTQDVGALKDDNLFRGHRRRLYRCSNISTRLEPSFRLQVMHLLLLNFHILAPKRMKVVFVGTSFLPRPNIDAG